MGATYKNKEYPSKALTKAGHVALPPAPNTPKNYVYNIRGTNGSGKSYAARLVMDEMSKRTGGESRFKTEEGVTVLEYDQLFVLGTYDNDCGGLDTIRDSKLIKPLVLKLLDQGKDVLIEGMMWSTIFGATHELNREARLAGHEMIQYGFEGQVGDFIDRVLSRRASKGNFEPYPLINMVKKVAPITHSMNHSIHFGGLVHFNDAQGIADHIIQNIDRKNPGNFRTEYHFYPDFEIWDSKTDADENFCLLPPQELINQYKSKQEASACSLFDSFGA